MRAISPCRSGLRRARPGAGFSLVELLITITIFSVLIGIGVPMMGDWLLTSKAAGATEFYAEGLRLARQQAVSHNAVSRFVIAENTANGQYDYRIDLCYPTQGNPCNEDNPGWSTDTAAAANDPQGAAGDKSIVRSAGALPKSDVLQPTAHPAGAEAVYFTSLGWVDTTFASRLTRLDLAPSFGSQGRFPASALAVPLSGVVAKCNPTVNLPDSRACPP